VLKQVVFEDSGDDGGKKAEKAEQALWSFHRPNLYHAHRVVLAQ